MKEYRAIIIDDEKNAREALGLMLAEQCPEIRLCGSVASAAEGREFLNKEDIDLIFLDISMPKENGFDFLRTIPRESYGFIFVTAFEEYAIQAFKANAIDYLLKPVDTEELKTAVAKAVQYHELRKMKANVRSVYNESIDNLDRQFQSQLRPVEKITIAEQFGFRIINVADLMYLEADSSYTILHLSGLDKIVATRSLVEFENILEGSMFYRIHKSTMINLKYLKAYSSYEGNFAELNDGTRLSIARRKFNEFKEAVEQFAKIVR